MAFVSGGSPDQDPNQNGNQNPLSQQAPMTSAPNAGAAGKATSASSSAPTQPFANLSSYLTANAPQIQGEADQIAGNLTSQYGDTSGAINKASADFGNSVGSAYTPNDPNVISSFQANPTAVAANPTQSAAFKGMYGDTYKGPANFEGTQTYQDLSGKVQSGAALASQVGTPSGLQSYLSSTDPAYTQGQGMLDASLLGSSPDAVKTISTAAQPFQNLPGQLNTAVATGNAAVQAAIANAAAAKAAAGTAYTGVADPFAQTLNNAYQSTAQKSIDYNNGLNDLSTKVGASNFDALTPAQQAEIGYNPQMTQLMKDYPTIFPTQAQNNPIDFGKYFTQGAQANMPKPSDTITPDQIAEYQALASLSGQGPNLNFDMPTASTKDSFHQFAGDLPQYNNAQAGAAIETAYNPMFTQLQAAGQAPQNVQDYMGKLNTVLGQAQPSPLPTSPQPAPGSPGDLGSGFHWDTGTGSWQPTIPLAPPGGQTNPGGGHHTF